jgi:pimeloyl-[acyl-carrier protein] methyl ester esterase
MSQRQAKCKPTLVLLHGWGVNHAVWAKLLELLPADQPVLALDLPGYGLASQAPAPYSLDAVAKQVAAQIPAGSLLLGWSLGGLVASQIALAEPAKVRALALLASSPCFMAQADWPGMSAQVLQQFAQSLSTDLALTVERFLAIQSMGSSSARQDTRLLKQAVLALPLPDARVLAAGLDLLQQCDLRLELPSLRMPLTYCFGRLDSLVPVRIAELLPAYLPTAQIHVFSKASHAPFISHSDEFASWLNQWLVEHSL